MDPNETLKQIDDLVVQTENTDAEVEELCGSLRLWVHKGGFEPDWGMWKRGTAAYHRWVRENTL